MYSIAKVLGRNAIENPVVPLLVRVNSAMAVPSKVTTERSYSGGTGEPTSL